MKYCPNCGKEIDEKAFVCIHCGVKQPKMGGGGSLDLDLGEKNRTTAAILALFLGGLGVHKFYLGDMTAGVLYLVFCFTFIPAILALIEGISYLTMSDEEFAAKFV